MLFVGCLLEGATALADVATPNLPSRDFSVTSHFFGQLGFVETWRDESWMIIKRGDLILEFFLHPGFDPAESWFSCCLRLADVGAFFEAVLSAGVPEKVTGWPRAHRPQREAWGGTVGALVDPDGTLLRLVQGPG
jgi:catechol 2,3-dioxygenase-like lactoylglutathione lyase family enzyme